MLELLVAIVITALSPQADRALPYPTSAQANALRQTSGGLERGAAVGIAK